jgi:hypothetical protein
MIRQWAYVSVCLPALLIGQPPSVRGPDYEISGQVLDAQTEELVAGATVTALIGGSFGQSQFTILTSSTGTFTIRNVPAGFVQLHCRRPGYVDGCFVQVSSMDGKPANAVLYLTRQAVISGTVMDQRGFAMLGAQVRVFRQAVVEGRRQLQWSGGATADDTGEFRVPGLAAGRYYLGVAASFEGQSKKRAYPPTFYPNSPDVTGAQFIDLRASQEERIEMRLTAQRAGEIRGSFPGGSLGSVSILPQRANLIPMWPGLGASYDTRDSSFKVPGVPAGTYILEGSATVDSQQVRASAVVTTNGGDVDGIVLTPRSGPALSGTVRVDGRTTQPFRSITLKSPQHAQVAEVDADGAFRFSNLPADNYRVVLTLGGSFFIRSILQGGRDVMSDGVAVGYGEPAPSVEIVVSQNGATIEGDIKPAESERPGPVVVALLRHAGDEMVLENQVYATIVQAHTRTRFSGGPAYSPGRFLMEGVGPGEYVLYVWRRDAEIEYTNAEYMRQFIAYGQPVSVVEGGKVTVKLQHLLSIPQ